MPERRKVIITCATPPTSCSAISTAGVSLGAGRNQPPIAAMSAAMGGNVRVGLEDSPWLEPGTLATSNAAQVRAAHQIIEGLRLEVATPDDARRTLQLNGGNDVAF